MGAPTLWQHVRQTVGRAVRETGQALDRTALRLESVAKTKYDFGDEPTKCMDHLSRHRQLFPLLAAGRPVLHPHVAYVAPCASLIGSVVVGKGASVWYGAVLRADTTANAESFNKSDDELLQATTMPVLIAAGGEDDDDDGENATTTTVTGNDKRETGAMAANALDKSGLQVSKGPFTLPDPERTPYSGGGIVIGEDTNIQDGCILTARTGHCLVGQGVTVGHLAQIHSSTVGDFSLIGMGSVLQEGCRVESESFIAAGAVISPGVVVPSGELWAGNPARKLRDLSDKERAKLHYQSNEYVQVAMGHRDVMELGGNLFEEVLPIKGGDELTTTELQEEQVASATPGRV